MTTPEVFEIPDAADDADDEMPMPMPYHLTEQYALVTRSGRIVRIAGEAYVDSGAHRIPGVCNHAVWVHLDCDAAVGDYVSVDDDGTAYELG